MENKVLECYYVSPVGEQYHLKCTSPDIDSVNLLLDQMNIINPKYISKDEFDSSDTLTLDIMNDEGTYKYGELTFKKSLLGGDTELLN